MLINSEVRKCVVFIAYQTIDGVFHTCGTAFFVGKEVPETKIASPTYLVTAKHVIDGIKGKGIDSVWLRHNVKNKDDAWYETKINNWHTHQSDKSLDVAIIELGILEIFDNLVIPFALCISDEKIKEHEVGYGDEVFITGLFKHHQGKKKSIPIVRVGNLACMTEEKIYTKDFGDIDAYLIEARSIGGLSGSPVFLNLGIARFLEGQVKHSNSGPVYYLLGLIHGHFDVNQSEFSNVLESDSETKSIEKINSGIAIVVPFHSIEKVIEDYQKTKSTVT